MLFRQQTSEFTTVHIGHNNIRDYEIGLNRFEFSQSFLPIEGAVDIVAEVPQNLVDQLDDAGLDAVAMGHSHVLGEVSLPGGTLWHTGAWLGLRSWLDVVDGVGALREGTDSHVP